MVGRLLRSSRVAGPAKLIIAPVLQLALGTKVWPVKLYPLRGYFRDYHHRMRRRAVDGFGQEECSRSAKHFQSVVLFLDAFTVGRVMKTQLELPGASFGRVDLESPYRGGVAEDNLGREVIHGIPPSEMKRKRLHGSQGE